MEEIKCDISLDELIKFKNEVGICLRKHKTYLYSFRNEDGTFFNQTPKFSLTSTITCLNSLISAELGEERESENLFRILLNTKWKSANLEENNCYTSPLMIYGLNKLKDDIDINEGENKKIRIILDKIKGIIKDKSGLKVQNYDENAFLTFMGFISYESFYGFEKTKVDLINGLKWLEKVLYHQLSNYYANDLYNKDAYQLGYSLITLLRYDYEISTPIINKAFNIFFSDQREDGSWDRYNPLFHYPEEGNAYCFPFELLKNFFFLPEKFHIKFEEYIENFEKARSWINTHEKINRTEENISGWCSYHHPNWKDPESWATACIFDFLRNYDSVLKNLIRKTLLSSLKAQYEFKKEYWNKILMDVQVVVKGKNLLLKDIVLDHVINPIKKGKRKKAIGILFYGPPGTGKTLYAKSIAQELKMPLIILNPSHFLVEGFGGLVRKATEIVEKLKYLENVVVLFDEMEELIRSRAANAEYETRLFTTSMLPMFSDLHEKENFVYICNTNKFENIDKAAIRPGRFDLSIFIGPPYKEESLKMIKEYLEKLDVNDDEKLNYYNIFEQNFKEKLGDLFYHDILDLMVETKNLILEGLNDKDFTDELSHIIKNYSDHAKAELKKYDDGIEDSKIHFTL
ncbi:hypothetical protein LCGC14_1714510 [marine sediment metagenome]|uniref:AAA+ ATPase domain-containing protein n=1 Tax=marine sediment metagenome TaxID=412755 RepID=A0A0F9KEA2_9ZZZZ